ncbi:MAG: hypothetical protein Q7U98_14655 [Methylicorpusculum sp.]|uniref:hypothetical protein n=1 Tax=Methylicorpusculum sp. TaxID=2713644 RepID=UPI0027158702|nr:hypothetical protein [Methylicorpusculum sp.]MDO8842754.1 hypothetical protein [Methylicorpusculum sp.]MDO8940391.1 hypothetical protein [Methylicorpusculum sp.]MDO9240154.1 hypothetical protein [Methylicorpusculum sp.]MDP2178281.1 hypothetical protein [Methylicorpusculum sp.]MDP2203998.1 hypothetical protein [Methylicorpusculum sp.]
MSIDICINKEKQTPKTSAIINLKEKGVGRNFTRMSASGMLPSNPKEGFTAFLERLSPAQNDAENIKQGIAA